MEKNENQKYWDPSYQLKNKSFDGVFGLNPPESTLALRLLKYHLEEQLGWGMSDELFIRVFKITAMMRNTRPWLGEDGGFWRPLLRIEKEFNIPFGTGLDIRVFQNFFRVFDFKRYNDKRHYENLIIHIPHSSTVVPECRVNPKELDEEEWKLIDLYADELFMPYENNKRIDVVVFPYCRFYCDVERLPNDPLEKRGYGISFERIFPDEIRRWGWRDNAYKLYARYHQKMVDKIISKSPDIFDNLLLIDCHSFSTQPTLLCANPPEDTDICIGFNEDETKPSKVVIGNIRNYFLSKGYSVDINRPFSNSKTFDVPGGLQYHSVMIEVSKKLYMSETTLRKTDGFARVHRDMHGLYDMLLRK